MERLDRNAAAEHRFDGPTARQILERAAMEQRRLDREHTDTYSLAELEEIAAQARISSEALCAAVEAHSRDPRSLDAAALEPRSRSLRSPSPPPQRAPASLLGRTLLAGAAVVTFVAVLITFPVIAQVLFWTTLVLSLLLLLGASPF